MLVNNGTASTEDIVQLAGKMQAVVKQELGITPKPECLLIGFKEYPLHK